MLIEDWRKSWKLWSVKFSALGAVIMAVFTAWPDSVLIIWQQLPPEVLAIFPERIVSGIATFIFVMSAISRVVKQNKLHERTDEQKAE